MPNTANLEKLNAIAAEIQKIIAADVKRGTWMRSYPGEQPTKENLRNSIPWNWIGLQDYDEINYVVDTVYPKLRKNGVLAKLR